MLMRRRYIAVVYSTRFVSWPREHHDRRLHEADSERLAPSSAGSRRSAGGCVLGANAASVNRAARCPHEKAWRYDALGKRRTPPLHRRGAPRERSYEAREELRSRLGADSSERPLESAF